VCRCGYALKGGDAAFSTADLERDLETIKELGQGANGTVFKAKHRPSGKIIALKRVKIANDAMLHDMQKEISIMNNCDSENIVDFYGSYVDRKEVWIAMEYCSGGSLTKLMERRGRAYTEEEASVIVRNVLKALVYMHMSRRCHRDIKPENILLSGRGVPKLADFGISVQMGKGIQQMATLIGTPIFLAPEIITSDGYNCFPASDHQLLTSRGFMFCHDLLAAIDCERDAAGRPLVRNGGIVKVRDWRGLRVASFDADRAALVYEQPLALVYNAPPPTPSASARAPLVQFTSGAEARRWSACGAAAASDLGDDAGVSVVATPQHNMYVRLGGDARMRKMPADAVLAAASDAVQFATRAPGGVLSGAGGARSEFLDALALAPCDATPFLELYGAWLGAPGGRLLFDSCGGALEWAALESDAQAAFVAERLAALGVAWHCEGRTLRVTATRWVDYFDAQYGHAFAGGAAYANVHCAAAAQRARLRVARGEFDGVSSADGSLLAALDGDAKWCWSWVWRLDAAALRAVLRGVVAAAGEQLTTRSARFRDELLRVLLHAGFAAHFVSAGAGAWALRFSERDAAPLRRSAGDHVRRLSAAEMHQYRGDATWCCTMSRGFVVTRRARAGKRGDGAVVRASQPTIQGNTKVDVWALGISLIILCDGAPPYGDVDPVRAMFVISQSKESPTLSQPAEWSKELNDFVACCLHRNPTERWSSIELLSHPYIAQYAHVRTVSTSVRHDKVQTVSADDDTSAAAAAATATAGASAAAAAGAGASAVSAVAAAAALPASASPPALPDDDGLARSDGKSRRRASERDEVVDVEKNEKEKKEKDRRERKEREEREERERKEKKEKEEKEEKERERKERKEREEREEKEREERKERERKEKKEKEEKEEKERERKEKKEREEREEKEREERKERERKEKKEREEREEKERKEDEEKKSRGSTRSRAADAVTRSNSDGKKSRGSGGADDAEDDDSVSSGGGGGGGGNGKESTRRRHRRTATPADQDDGDDSGSSAKNEGKRRTSKDKEIVKQASVSVTSTRKQGATTNALDAVISAARAEPKQRKDDDKDGDKDSDNRSPRSKSTVAPRVAAKGDVPKNLSGSPQRRATPSAIAAESFESDRVRSSSDADKHEIVFVGERPAGQAPVPKPAGAAPRPKAPAPAPPASSPSGNATASSAELTKNRMRAGSISKTTSVSMATAADDDEAERLEWERILAEEREKAKRKTSTSGSTRK
jgi:serine/threonine protein kinase